jgi:hypothetical protein
MRRKDRKWERINRKWGRIDWKGGRIDRKGGGGQTGKVGEDRQEVWRMKKRREKRSVIGQEKREADRKNSISGQEMGIATQEACIGHSHQKGWRQAEKT